MRNPATHRLFARPSQKRLSDSRRTCLNPPADAETLALVGNLCLNGAPLPAPQFYRTQWRPGQTFTAEQDPDRTAQRWDPPSFVARKDPREQARQTTVRELAACPRGGRSFARVVENVLTPAECEELLCRVNAKGFSPALLNIGGGMQKVSPGARDGHRVIVDSYPLAGYLLEVLRPHIPDIYPPSHGTGRSSVNGHLSEVNERMRFLCYTPGQQFPAHCDGCYARPQGHERFGDRSYITVQLYLHDVPEEHGGATTFLSGAFGGGKRVPYQPKCGSVLLFTQDLMHEGSLVRKGLKYTLRTEVMYGRRRAGCALPRAQNSGDAAAPPPQPPLASVPEQNGGSCSLQDDAVVGSDAEHGADAADE